MLPSASERTNSFIAVGAVLAVALCNVIFEADWANEPGPRRAVAAAGVSEAPVLAPPAAPAAPPVSGPAAQANEPPAAPPPQCDIAACTAAYRTFRASDCTYMPSAGVRRLCSKGRPPQ